MSTVIKKLLSNGRLRQENLQSLRREREVAKRSLPELLLKGGHLNEEEFFETAKATFSGQVIDLSFIEIDQSVIKLIPFDLAVLHGVIPVRVEDENLYLAMSDPSDIMARDEVHFLAGLNVIPLLARQQQITTYCELCYRQVASVQDILKSTMDCVDNRPFTDGNSAIMETVDLSVMGGDDSSFIQLINKIICDAVKARASDIHIEPQIAGVDVRYRVDGYLQSVVRVPRDLQERLAVRIKLLAKMDITEKRKPQDGRIKIVIEGRKIDLRISVIPVFYGEKLVLRILDIENARLDMASLGLQPDEYALFTEAIRKPQGAIIVTGPTGSGKTTTLYAALQHIKCGTKNIVTIEDPIEYLIEGLNQLQLSHHKDVTFATGLRSILRQDPDVILVGEIRDRETAEIALRASLTGHLVFSTLHTNNSAASITRLRDTGIEPYMIASSVNLFIAQRLIRLICPHCCEKETPDDKLLYKFRQYLRRIRVNSYYRGKGCSHCNHTGFYGRTSIFEIMNVDEGIRELIYNRSSERLLFQAAVSKGMRTLAESGLLKVAAGLTTLQEVSRVVDVLDTQEPSLGPAPMTVDASGAFVRAL